MKMCRHCRQLTLVNTNVPALQPTLGTNINVEMSLLKQAHCCECAGSASNTEHVHQSFVETLDDVLTTLEAGGV